jgi:hypothetical protein
VREHRKRIMDARRKRGRRARGGKGAEERPVLQIETRGGGED